MNYAIKSRTRSVIWAIAYYLCVAITAAAQPFVFAYDSSAVVLIQLAIALPPIYWMTNDAKSRGLFIPHVVQPFIASIWWFAIPTYLVATRKWWGVLYSLIHLVLTYVLLYAFYLATALLVWGPDVFG